ncbi:MAG: phosphomevalonate kinase [Bradymonadia bacterium]
MNRWRCPGKLFWLGEYAVLEGAPAIVAAVDRYADVTREASSGLTVSGSVLSARVAVSDAPPFVTPAGPDSALIAAVAQTLAERGALRDSGAVHADSSALSTTGANARKLGLGSSGAVAAGLSVALATDEALARWSAAELVDIAVQAHRVFQHGRGSGADIAASVYGGVIRFERGRAPVPIEVPQTLEMAVFDSGVSAHTPTLVGVVKARVAADPKGAADVLGAAARLAEQGAEALSAGDVHRWCSVVDAYADAMRALTRWSGAPIMNDPVEATIRAAQDQGWHAKASGAGGGDIIVGFRMRAGSGPFEPAAPLDGHDSVRTANAVVDIVAGQLPDVSGRFSLAVAPVGVIATRG